MDAAQEAFQQTYALLEAAANPYYLQHRETNLVSFMIQQIAARLIPCLTGDRPDWRNSGNYICMEHFVLVHGKYYRGTKLSKRYRRGVPKFCFDNSRNAMDLYGLSYVEGYVEAIIPVLHAWNSDLNGDVVDTTLTDEAIPVHKRAYFGVQFDDDYARFNEGSLVDAWREDWPLLRNAELVNEVVIPSV